MARIKEIIDSCKTGHVQEAYEQAKSDMDTNPNDPWEQRKVGWALNYLMQSDNEMANFSDLLVHLDELKDLKLLDTSQDAILFDNVLFKISGFIKSHINPTGNDSTAKISSLFSKLCDYDFNPSKGYSYLLQNVIKVDGWPEMADFLDWWNLEKLTTDDYVPYQMNNGRTIMSLAEQAFIAKSKALLRLNDKERIEGFLPQLDNLMETHSEFTYPGYFYGKLLLSLGSNKDEALRVLLPFARKKASEFWVWQLMSDVFVDEQEKQLACLLRAVNSHTQESFLGKVRIKLAKLYIQRHDYDLAKYQIDKITQNYLSQGWHLPYEIDMMVHEPWINSIKSSDRVPIDYTSITDGILCEGTKETIAIVAHYDANTKKTVLIYGKGKRTIQKLRFKVGAGSVLKINYIIESDEKVRILKVRKDVLPANLDFAKEVEGKVRKRQDKDFAFVATKAGDYFISPNIVSKYKLQDSEFIKCMILYSFNHKKNEWDWSCVNVNR